MALKLEIRSIGDEIPFDLGPSEALAFDYHYKTPETSQAKSNWVDSYLLIRGRILGGIPDPNPVLPPWANTIWTPKNSMVEYYRDVTVEETRAGGLIRKVRFPKAYVIEYYEYASDQEGEMGFSLLLGQKKDCLGEVEINGERVQQEADSALDSRFKSPSREELSKRIDAGDSHAEVAYQQLYGTEVSSLTHLPEDQKMALAIVYAEARGESTAGQKAVASVFMNRLHNDTYDLWPNTPSQPNTLKGILTDPNQFSPYRRHNDPDSNYSIGLKMLTGELPLTKDMQKIIDNCLPIIQGKEKPTTDAQSFYTATSDKKPKMDYYDWEVAKIEGDSSAGNTFWRVTGKK